MLTAAYVATGLVLCFFAWITWRDVAHPRRFGGGAFWFVLGMIFICGDWLPHWLSGLLVVALVCLDGGGFVTRTHAVPEGQPAVGNRIFIPVLVIPAVTFIMAVAFRLLGLDANQGALVGLALGGVAAMATAMYITDCDFATVMDAGRHLNETMGAVNILPQLLASLGIIFTAAKVGDLLAAAIYRVVAPDHLFLLVLANCVAMASFSILMGNSFAAFPVIATGILVPLVIKPFGADPAMAAIITLTAGSSGTLMTPMAANFNVVPAALLEMNDTYGIIKFQLPYAAAMWCGHVLLIWALIALR